MNSTAALLSIKALVILARCPRPRQDSIRACCSIWSSRPVSSRKCSWIFLTSVSVHQSFRLPKTQTMIQAKSRTWSTEDPHLTLSRSGLIRWARLTPFSQEEKATVGQPRPIKKLREWLETTRILILTNREDREVCLDEERSITKAHTWVQGVQPKSVHCDKRKKLNALMTIRHLTRKKSREVKWL